MHLLQFKRYKKNYDFISFTKIMSRAQRFPFFKFLKNKMYFFFFIFYVFCVCFFYLKQMENGKTKIFAVLVIQVPIKSCSFQPSRLKTVGEDTFLAAKV